MPAGSSWVFIAIASRLFGLRDIRNTEDGLNNFWHLFDSRGSIRLKLRMSPTGSTLYDLSL